MNLPDSQSLANSRKLVKELERIANLLQQLKESIENSAISRTATHYPAPIIRPDIHVPAPVIHEVNTENEATQRRERNKFRIAIWTLLSAVVAVGLSFATWWEFNEQNLNQSTANINSAATADRSLNYTREQIRMSREQEVIDQRAWVGIRNIQPLSGRIGFMAEVINTGKTPAYVTGIWKNAKFLKGRRTELPDHPVYDSETDLPNGAGVDFPGQVAIQIALSAPDYAVDKEPNEIRDGKTTLVFYGRVEYRDVFDNNHWTTFCYHYMLSWVGGPPAAFVPCKRNNATDHQH